MAGPAPGAAPAIRFGDAWLAMRKTGESAWMSRGPCPAATTTTSPRYIYRRSASSQVLPRERNGRRASRHATEIASAAIWGFASAPANPPASQVRKAIRPWAPRQSLQPGTVLIVLAGRFRGKRVILVKALDQGVLLVTGPFKINGVPIRRVNSRYVIATSQKIDLAGVDQKKIEEVAQPKYFTGEKAKEKAGEEAFFKQGEKAQVCQHRVFHGACPQAPSSDVSRR